MFIHRENLSGGTVPEVDEVCGIPPRRGEHVALQVKQNGRLIVRIVCGALDVTWCNGEGDEEALIIDPVDHEGNMWIAAVGELWKRTKVQLRLDWDMPLPK